MEDFESAFTNENNYTLNSFSHFSAVLKTGEALSVGNPANEKGGRMEKTRTTHKETMEHIKEREDVATNFVLEKLKNAGIEVVTDKDEFNRILEAEKLLQKMVAAGESPEKIERQRQRVNGLVASQETMNLSDDSIANAFKQLDRSLRFNANFEIQSEGLGEEVSVFPGSTGKHGLGIRHIIEERTKKDNLSLDETTALSALIVDAVQTGDITRDSKGQAEFTKNGIVAIVRKDYFGNEKNWILTGFAYDSSNAEKNREATETIQTVIAKYGQSPDYSYFRSQVGAVVASLDLNISQTPTKSSGVLKTAGIDSETEVKDSAISVTSLRTETINRRASILCPSDTYSLLSHVKSEEQEHFGVILLDAAHNVKAVNTVSVGTINKTLVHQREVFSEAVKAKAAAIIVFHNHPSGNPSPSDDDLNTTRALLKASEVVGIPILDHVIAAENSYYSFLEHDILDDLRRGTEFLFKDNQTYGFTHNGKVYLNPEIMNSNAAVHEYTHLWDTYTQNSNPELWERGKEILSKTHLWSEVKADPNYADISNDDDLILSEVHARICGRIAQQVLERIAREDGEIARDRAIDWDSEVWEYLSSEFLTAEDKEILFEGQHSKEQINEFISLSLKDLMEGKEIALSQSMGQSKAFEESKKSKTSVLELKSDSPKERVREITSQLEKGVKDLFESKKYQEYLDVMSRFHRYSANNLHLIALQNPNATQVAGFQTWKKDFERSVKKGEKGIKILVPVVYKKKAKEHEKILDEGIVAEGEDEERLTFRIGHVFDISQTEGKDLPSLGADELTGDVERYSEIYSALERLSPYPIYFEDIKSGAKGYCSFSDKKIAIKNGMSEAQTIKTLVHEISHAKLHENGVADKRTAEVQAESVSYTVCKHFGLDTSDYSFAYVTGWSSGKDTKELKGSLDLIRRTSVEFIEGIEKTISEEISREKTHGENIEIKPEEVEISDQERAEFKAAVEKNPSEARQLQKAFEIALYKNPLPLVEVPLTRENYNELYPQGYVETPIETVKLGEHQFEKLQRSDRKNLLLAGYETLTKPSIVFDLYSIDRTDGELKPVHVYGKSFYRKESGHKRVVESVIIFREDENIAIGIHNKDANNFVKQIKTADDIVYCDENISRVASLVLKDGGDHVRLYGINTEAINSRYNANEILSTQQFVDKEKNQKLVEPVKKENAMKLEERAMTAEEMTSILQEPKVEINGEMTESLPLLNENRWIDGREMPVWIIANAIDYINEKTEYTASKIADIDSIPEEIRKDAISVALKNHIKDGGYSYLLDSKSNLRQESFDREVDSLNSDFKDTAKLMFETLDEEIAETLNEENTIQNNKEEKTMEATEKHDGKANGGVKNLDVIDVICLLEEAGVKIYFDTPDKSISLKIGMPLGNSVYNEYEFEFSLGGFIDANDIAKSTLNFGKQVEENYWGKPNQKIKDSIGNVCKKIEERKDEKLSFKDVFSFLKEEGFRTTVKNASEIWLIVKGEADNYENRIKFRDANDLTAKIIELGNNFSREEYYNEYERDDDVENDMACFEMFGMSVGEANKHLEDLAGKVGNIFDDVCRKLEERAMTAESNYQKKEEKPMESQSINEGAQKNHNSLDDVKAVQNKTENKPMEATKKHDKRTVADLDLEYQSKASKVADLDLEYPYKNRLSEKSFSGKFVPDNNARLIKEAIESNTAPFLPDERGEISARPIVNANTGFCLNLKDLLPMQVKQETAIVVKDGQAVIDNTYYSPIVATKKSIDAAHTSIKPGERGVFFNFKRADGTIGTSQYFFPEQTEHPEKVIQNAIEKIGASHEGRGNENGIITQKTIKITSSEPKEYLAKYQAAMRTNSFLECSPEISREFVKKFSVVLDNQLAEKKDFKPEIGTLNKLLFDADKMSYAIAKQMEKNEKAPSQQKHPERNKKSEMSR